MTDEKLVKSATEAALSFFELLYEKPLVDIYDLRQILHVEKSARLAVNFEGPVDHTPQEIFKWLYLDTSKTSSSSSALLLVHKVDLSRLLPYNDQYSQSQHRVVKNVSHNDCEDLIAVQLSSVSEGQLDSVSQKADLILFLDPFENFKLLFISALPAGERLEDIWIPQQDADRCQASEGDDDDDDYWGRYDEQESEPENPTASNDGDNAIGSPSDDESKYFASYDQKEADMDAQQQIFEKMLNIYEDAKKMGISNEKFLELASSVALQ